MKKTVRSMVAASLVGVMAVSLAGCGSNNQTPSETTAKETEVTGEKTSETTAKETEATGEKITLRFMHDWPEYETQFNQIIEDFEQLNHLGCFDKDVTDCICIWRCTRCYLLLVRSYGRL